jgi:RecG-like helicase
MSSPFPPYYQPRLNKLGFDLYRFITYLPFRLEIISPVLSCKAELYHLTGQIIDVQSRGKFLHCTIKTSNSIVSFFDFGKKINYLNNFNQQNQYQLLLTRSNDYYSLTDIVIYSNKTQNTYHLGHLNPNLTYYRPVYTLLSYQLRSKQINQIHASLAASSYLLNLEGLIPNNNLIPQVLNLRPIHKPQSQVEFDTTLQQWKNLQTFLNLVFLDSLETITPRQDTLITEYPTGLIEQFQQDMNLTLSSSQLTTIDNILSQITYKPLESSS